MAYVKKAWKQGDDITVDALNNMETQYDEGVAYTDGKVATHDHGANGGATISYNDLKDRPSLGTAASKNVGTTEGTIPILGPNGKLADSVIPALAINEAQVVDSESAMLSLQAQRGDIAIRSDINKAFVLGGTGDPSVLSDWLELLTPTDHVLSVAGKTGAVTLTKADVGLDKVDNLSRSDILDSPALTGTPTAPSPPKADNSTRVATTNHVKQVVADYAPLDSPSFTGDIAVTGTVDGVDLSERAPIWDAKQDAIDQGLNSYDIPTFRNVNLGSTSSLEWDKVADTYAASSDVVSLVDKAMEWDGKETPSGAQSKVDAHASRFDNPHGVTKSQVGLSNVDNIKQATKAEFDAHDVDDIRHITASERTAWNAKQDALSGNVTGHYHSSDRNRSNHTGTQPASTITGLAAVATSGKASDIIQDASHRFVTDSEKSAWNSKADGSIFTPAKAAEWDRISTHTHDGTTVGGPKISYNNLTNKPTIPTKLSQLATDDNNQRVSIAKMAEWDGKADGSIFTQAKAAEWDRISTHTHDGTTVGGPKISYNNLEDKPTIPTKLSQLATDYNNQRVSAAEKAEWNAKARPPVPFYRDMINVSLGPYGSYSFSTRMGPIVTPGRIGCTPFTLWIQLPQSYNNVDLRLEYVFDDNSIGKSDPLPTTAGQHHVELRHLLPTTDDYSTKKYIKDIKIRNLGAGSCQITASLKGFVY